MIEVYAESNSHAELWATFEDESFYMASLPALEKLAEEKKMKITEKIIVVEEKNPLDEKVDKILEYARAEIKKNGCYTNSTCDTNSYGWSMLEHQAMEKIQRNSPDDLHVSKNYKFEVWDWTITEK